MANFLFTKVSKGIFTEIMNPKAKVATQVGLEEEDLIVVTLENKNAFLPIWLLLVP